MNKRKLLFIYGPLGAGGAERVLIDLLSNLNYEKYEVDLAMIVKEGALLPEVPKEVNIIPIWPSYNIQYKIAFRLSIWFGWNLLFKKQINSKLKSTYDASISFLEGMPLKLHRLIKGNHQKITWVHCDLFKFPYEANQFYKGEEIDAYNKMDRVVCVSNDTLSAFKKRFVNCNSESLRIYNPIDIIKIKKLSEEEKIRKEDVFTISSVGRLTKVKRFDRVIRLSKRLKQEGFKFKINIIGGGELLDELKKIAKDLDVEDDVFFHGYLKNPYSLIKNSDLLLQTSDFEGFGLVLCEAMCLGVPVVSTKTAGSVEILNDTEYGMLCEHDDLSIYNSVVEMIQNHDLRNDYILKGKLYSEKFDVKKFIQNVETILDEN